jgi:hypothetical protein
MTLIKEIVKFFYKKIPLIYRLKISNRFTNPYGEVEDRYKIIFIHIPKAAGNGVTQTLFGTNSHGHFTWKDYARNKKKFDLYKKFSYVRNPYARFVSAFYYLKNGGMSDTDKEFVNKYLSGVEDINQFVRKLQTNEEYLEQVLSWTHFKPQVDFLLGAGDRKIDDINQVESIDESLPVIARSLSIDIDRSKRVNAGGAESSSYDSVLDDNSKRFIAYLYHDDFEEFNYEV